MPSTIGVAEAATRSLATLMRPPHQTLELRCIVVLGIEARKLRLLNRLTAWAVYVKPDLSTLVVDLGLTGLPNVVGIDTVRIVIPRLKVPLIFKSRPHAPAT
jgi:hypothetical protein